MPRPPVYIEKTRRGLEVVSDFHPDFNAGAQRLKRRFDAATKANIFDLDDEDAVRALCREVYGTDGSDNVDLVDVECTLMPTTADEVFAFGRQLAKRFDYQTKVKLGRAVVVKSGSFPRQAGDLLNPQLFQSTTEEPVVLTIHDVPVTLVNAQPTVITHPPAPLSARPQTEEERLLAETMRLERPFANFSDKELQDLRSLIDAEIASRTPLTS